MPNKEYHHFQFINPINGEIPFSVTMLVKYNRQESRVLPPISADELIEFNEVLKNFDGNFKKLFSQDNK